MKLAVGFILYEDASARYLADFLPSLERALDFLDPADCRVYAYDNSGPERRENRDALEQFRSGGDHIRPEIRYFSTGQNLGFSRAYNILIREALAEGAEYFLVINPDTVLEPEAVARLLRALEDDGSLSSVAPKIRRWDFLNHQKTEMIDSLGLILEPGLRFLDLGQGRPDDGSPDGAEILGPSGAAGLFRLSALEKISFRAAGQSGGGPVQFFDENFFMYKEDCDLAYRLFLAGYRSISVPEALVYHDRTAVVSGPGPLAQIRGRRARGRLVRAWSFKNQHLLFLKYWSRQNFFARLIIIGRIVQFFIFSLILEQFLLLQYGEIRKAARGLTNTK